MTIMTTPEFDVSPVGRSFAPPAADLCIFPLFLFAGKRFTPVARPALPGSGMSAAPDAGRCHRRRLSLLVGAWSIRQNLAREAVGRAGSPSFYVESGDGSSADCGNGEGEEDCLRPLACLQLQALLGRTARTGEERAPH